MAHQIEVTSGGKLLLFLAMIAAVLTAIGKLLIQPLFSAWIIYTLQREKARLRAVICEVFKDDIAELVKSAAEIRECQSEQGKQLARVEGYLSGRSE